ncbi:MAG: permease prefix domain 2-containing transporter, partial [Cyclobacteriaceae bacterium]|nr:permease prefix domain 2-containing transporter [Cyclobacteriaceae bacterium]
MNKKASTPLPLSLALRLLRFFLRPDLAEEVEGDLEEQFQASLKSSTPFRAKMNYWWQVVNYLRPFALKNVWFLNVFNFVLYRHYFLFTVRHTARNKFYFLTNLFGLSSAIFCALLILLWVQKETGYDRFHPGVENIYRVMTNYNNEDGAIQTTNTVPRTIITNRFSQDPNVKSATQIYWDETWPGKLCFKDVSDENSECLYSKGAYVDDQFFLMFPYFTDNGNTNPLQKLTDIALSKELAGKLFPGQDPIGREIQNYGQNYTVTHVFNDLPDNSSLKFDFIALLDLYQKLRGLEDVDMNNDSFLLTFVGFRQPPDTTTVASILDPPSVLSNGGPELKAGYFIQPLSDWHLHDHFENGKPAGGRIEYVRMFLVIAGVIVLLACINFVNLATARATARGKEVGLRKTVGARISDLVRQHMGEAFFTVVFSMAMALGLVWLLLPHFSTLISEPLTFDLSTGPMPYYIAALTLLIGLLSGFYPAVVLSSFSPMAALKDRLGNSGPGIGIRKTLTSLQLVSSSVLILFTIAIFLQLRFIHNKNLGFDRSSIVQVAPTYPFLKKFDAFRTSLMQNPDIIDVSLSDSDLLGVDNSFSTLSWEGKASEEIVPFNVIRCDDRFFETFNISLSDGTGFSPHDSSHVRKAIPTEKAVKTMGLEEPVGAVIKWYDEDAVVTGIAKDLALEPLHIEQRPVVFIYEPSALRLSRVSIKYKPGRTQEAMAAITRTYHEFEPNLPILYDFMDETFDAQYKSEAVLSRLSVFFTSIAIGVALLGIVALSSYSTLKRTREVGLRKIHGASTTQIILLLSGNFTKLALVSALISIPIGIYVNNT